MDTSKSSNLLLGCASVQSHVGGVHKVSEDGSQVLSSLISIAEISCGLDQVSNLIVFLQHLGVYLRLLLQIVDKVDKLMVEITGGKVVELIEDFIPFSSLLINYFAEFLLINLGNLEGFLHVRFI